MAPLRETAAAITPVSLSGFHPHSSASDLAGFLESVTGGEVLRCRVKTTWTPPESAPDFSLALPAAAPMQCGKRRRGGAAAAGFRSAPPPPDERAPPHAFVHFAHPAAARRAAAGSGLLLHAPSTARTGPRCAARRRRGTAPFRFTDSFVEVGNLRSPHDFVAAWRGPAGYASVFDLVVDPSDETCRLEYSGDTAFAFPGTSSAAVVLACDVKLEFAVLDVDEVLVFQAENSLLLRLSAAPLLYYRTAADDVYESVHADLIVDDADDGDPWVRTTDVTPGGAIGRCWVYKVSFGGWHWPMMDDALAYLKERVPVVVVCDGGLTVRDEREFGRPTQDLFFSVQHYAEGLEFPVWYLVNALVHKGTVNQHQLTPEFFGLLMREAGDVNVAALTGFLGEKFPVFDACHKLANLQDRASRDPKSLRLGSSRSKAGGYNVEARSLVITPTRAYCLPPQLERSNRVIRHFHHVADRFLRVTFMDEGKQPLKCNALYLPAAPIIKDMISSFLPQKTAVYRRARRVLIKGFHLCGRKYSFLAFSSNQLRNRSAWFFAEDGMTTAASIRGWMGQFPSKNVAKHAARMGQCFTSSYATVFMQPDEVNEFLEDVTHNGYNFSDGIGKITPELAMEVAERLPLMGKDIPSAFQIRYAGFKGVVALWQYQNDGIRLSLRPSMRKFESTHSVLEVVSWTRFQPGFLNRQIITLLTALGVPDKVFWQMQETMVHNLDRILLDKDIAFKIATSCPAEHGTTLGLMLSAGFDPATEAHLRAMLLAIRSSQLQGLLEKTKIFVPKARWLMGCLDELGILEQGQCFIRASYPSLNNSFVKHSSRFSCANKNTEVIVGTVVMAKNPCLHPGDVRILEAVDVPELYHLVDCLVFPKNGERPHANEASGSDLDGDVYFVTWDEKLVPPRKKSWDPMDYSPAEAKQIQRQVRQHDIIDFFLKNMTSDNIGRISNAHVVQADRSKYGARDYKCIRLAELAATAVDSHKTGQNVTMPPFLRPKEYPDFMEKEDDISYKSEKIIGRLYRSAKLYYQERSLEGVIRNNVPDYDTDLEVPGASGFLTEAWQCKCSYEEHLNVLLNQCNVATEAELVTGEIWSLTENNKKKKHDTKERLKYAYSELQQQFRGIFESLSVGHGAISEARKNMEYEMKASAWYKVTYHPEWIRRSREMMEPNAEAKLSFAWIPVDHLVRIKMRRLEEEKLGGRLPLPWGYISDSIRRSQIMV